MHCKSFNSLNQIRTICSTVTWLLSGSIKLMFNSFTSAFRFSKHLYVCSLPTITGINQPNNKLTSFFSFLSSLLLWSSSHLYPLFKLRGILFFLLIILRTGFPFFLSYYPISISFLSDHKHANTNYTNYYTRNELKYMHIFNFNIIFSFTKDMFYNNKLLNRFNKISE